MVSRTSISGGLTMVLLVWLLSTTLVFAATSINIPGGTTREQNELGGAKFNLFAVSTNTGDIEWDLDNDGQYDDATGSPIKPTIPLGVHTIGLKVWNSLHTKFETASVVVTIQDTTGPDLTAPNDVTAEQGDADGTAVSLGTPTVSDICDADVEVNNDAPAVFPLGTTVVTWTAEDDSGNTSTDTQSVTVEDTSPPTFSVGSVKDKLWPPNHKLVLVATIRNLSDICDADPDLSIDVTCNEPINGPGDGNTDSDWLVVQENGTWQVWLRAERAGASTGRIYRFTITATDESGNTRVKYWDVTVPHDE